ncbi:helix-turn-helix domain-containing protein [Pelosinus propionicus]|uniref:Helix-turn-helix domain-containing protein n=1 Tax=Pelosinus propionicus DSM 13327 TaxID=1123291 RepID=A0A1I4QB88_9FIRM|nr:helix-turn-helix domain-containing protein [Pelosinus propionicus]SFM36913.1 Helix-turn-helix domain-containing protein [Pelosinus propionicus DSM 13327]
MTKRVFWTEEEELFLINNWNKGVDYCSKKTKRSNSSLYCKAVRLGLGGCARGSQYLSGFNIADILGVSKTLVYEWINKGLLKYKLAPFATKKIYLIDLRDFEKFLESNQNLWDSRKMKSSLWFNSSPQWFKDKKKQDRQKPPNGWKKWTAIEQQSLLSMLTRKYAYENMGEILGRSRKSITSKLRKLNM